MSDRRFPSQPDDLLRRLGSQVVPVDEPARVEQRREQVVAALSRSIRETARSKRRSSRSRLIWGVGLAASLALGIGIAARLQHTHEAALQGMTVADVHGAVVVTESGESRVLSRRGMQALRAFGEIETAPEAEAEIRSQKSVVHIGPATKLTVPQTTIVEERYRLALGRVEISVDKDSRITRSVVVETPNAEVVVHGTVFAVDVSSRGDHLVTDVSVTRGSVWVLAHGVQVAVLGPGQRWSSDTQTPGAAPPRAIPGSDARDKREATRVDSARPLESAASAELAVPVEAAAPVEPSLPLESAARVERAAPRGAVRVPRHEPTSAELKASTLAEQSRMFQDAIDARNRGDDPRAAELFARLLARYPAYEEAEVQLFRAQKRLGRAAAAAAEARRYLAQHPQGFAHEEARGLALSPAPSH